MKRIYLSSTERPQIDQIGSTLAEVLKKALGDIEVKVIDPDNFHCTLEFNDEANPIDCDDFKKFIINKCGIDFRGIDISVYNYKAETTFGFAFTKKSSNEFDKNVDKLMALKDKLDEEILGQSHAIEVVIDGLISAYSLEKTRKDDKPFASFILAGASHTGKSRLAFSVAEGLGLPVYMFGKQEYLLEEPVFSGLQSIIMTGKRSVVIFNEFEHMDYKLLSSLTFINQAGEVGIYTFKNLILFFITNAGSEIYSRKNFFDYAGVTSQEVISALAEERNEKGYPIFSEHLLKSLNVDSAVIFNNLSPFTRLLILTDYIESFKKELLSNTNITVECDPYALATYVLFAHPDLNDIAALNKFAEAIINEQVTFLAKQYNEEGKLLLNEVRNINISIPLKGCSKAVEKLFSFRTKTGLIVAKEEDISLLKDLTCEKTRLKFVCNQIDAKKYLDENEVDFIFVDPTIAAAGNSLTLLDVEDFESEGMNAFHYFVRYCNNVPLYILVNIQNMLPPSRYESLLSLGARGYAVLNPEKLSDLDEYIDYLCSDLEFSDDIIDLNEQSVKLQGNPRQSVVNKENLKVLDVQIASLELVPDEMNIEEIRADELRYVKNIDDIMGNEIAKKVLLEASEFLSNTQEYLASGALPQKMILLQGGPASGKTGLIKVIARKARADLISVDCKKALMNSDIHDVFKLLRTTFAHARKMAPAIVHLDNLLYLFSSRVVGMMSEELIDLLQEELLINQRNTLHPVLVVAEAGYGELQYINPEFGELISRRVATEFHKVENVEEYLRRLFARKGIESISKKALHNFARRSMVYNYREINDLFNFVLLQSRGKTITDEYLADVFDLYSQGDEREQKDEGELLAVAYHEMGHYLLMRLAGDKPSFITIVARGDYGGYTMPGDITKWPRTRVDYLNEMCISYGGRAAEVILNGEDKGINTGISSDIRHATYYAYVYVAAVGMGGLISYYDANYLYDANLNSDVRKEMEKVQREQYDRALRLLQLNRANLDLLAKALYEKRFIMGEDAEELLPDDKLIRE